MFYIGLYWEQHEKNFLSETKRQRALTFGMYVSSNKPLQNLFKL